jgi:DNA polymerase I-like protein with 3'-5' exonuclease and polymerase domains
VAKIINTAEADFSAFNADENHWVYNGLDCCVTYDVLNNLLPMVSEPSLSVYDFSRALQAPVAEMCLRGILVNKNRRRKVLTEMRGKLSILEQQLEQLIVEGVGVPMINWRSPTQLSNLLYQVMNLPVQKKRNANGIYAPSTDRDALEKLQIYYISAPIINHLLLLRDLGKSIGFLETGIDPDGRMRSDLKIAGTVTGRFASSVTDFGTGTNLQNVTESLRSVFVADPGYKFANLDLEQGDSRNVGAICWNLFCDHPDWDERSAGAYLDACESGDLHTTVTKMTHRHLPWGTAPDREIAERICYRHFDYRFMSKKAGHGSNYLGSPGAIAKETKFPIQSIKEFQDAYFQAFPCIPAWHESIKYRLKNFSQITNFFGRRRFFFGRPNDRSTWKDAAAFEGSSNTSDEINTGILKLWRANRVQLLMQVHDSILFQFPEEQENEIVPWALEALKTHLELKKGRGFFVPTEAKTGWNWGNYSEENPDGLKKWKGGDDRSRMETQLKLSLFGELGVAKAA